MKDADWRYHLSACRDSLHVHPLQALHSLKLVLWIHLHIDGTIFNGDLLHWHCAQHPAPNGTHL